MATPPNDAFNKTQRDQIIRSLYDQVMKTLEGKALEYAADEVANQNFYDCAVGRADAIDVCILFLQKHIISIRRWSETRTTHPGAEPILGRIIDAIAYLGILHTLIVEAHNDMPEVLF